MATMNPYERLTAPPAPWMENGWLTAVDTIQERNDMAGITKNDALFLGDYAGESYGEVLNEYFPQDFQADIPSGNMILLASFNSTAEPKVGYALVINGSNSEITEYSLNGDSVDSETIPVTQINDQISTGFYQQVLGESLADDVFLDSINEIVSRLQGGTARRITPPNGKRSARNPTPDLPEPEFRGNDLYYVRGMENQLDKFKASGITVYFHDLITPTPIRRAPLVRGTAIRDVLGILGLQDKNIKIRKSGVAGAFCLEVFDRSGKRVVQELVYGPKKYALTDKTNYNKQEVFMQVLSNLGPALKLKVNVYNPGSTTNPPTRKTMFNVYLNSAPRGSCDIPSPVSMFGISLNEGEGGGFAARVRGYPFSGRGIPITDDNCNDVGELVDNNLFIYYNLTEYTNKATVGIMEKLVEKTIEVYNYSTEQKKEILAGRNKVAYVKLCSKRHNRQIKEYENTLSENNKKIESLCTQLTELSIARESIGNLVAGLKVNEGSANNKYATEFSRIMRNPKIKNIEITNTELIIYTEFIRIISERIEYDIGEFKVVVNLQGNKFVRMYNLSKYDGKRPTKSGYNTHHPHVDGSGTPCLGTLVNSLPQLIGSQEFEQVSRLVIDFLEQANLHDPVGREISKKWPVTKKDGN